MYSDNDDPQGAGFPHSEIHGSKLARNSPWLNAACYVLHRLSVPRHSPNALQRLITKLSCAGVSPHILFPHTFVLPVRAPLSVPGGRIEHPLRDERATRHHRQHDQHNQIHNVKEPAADLHPQPLGPRDGGPKFFSCRALLSGLASLVRFISPAQVWWR